MATADEIRKIVLRYYRHVDAGELDELFSLFSDDIIYERSGNPPIVGIEDFKRFYRNSRIIKEGRHEILDVIVEGNVAAVRGRFSGVLKDGRSVDFGFADFFVFDKDRVRRRYTYTDLGRI